MAPDVTGEEQADTRFKPGQSGNPAGRPKGSRSRLSERFLADFLRTWEEHGITALRKLASDDPAALVRAAVSLIPAQFEHSGPEGGPVEVRDMSLIERRRRVAAYILKIAGSVEGDPDARPSE